MLASVPGAATKLIGAAGGSGGSALKVVGHAIDLDLVNVSGIGGLTGPRARLPADQVNTPVAILCNPLRERLGFRLFALGKIAATKDAFR